MNRLIPSMITVPTIPATTAPPTMNRSASSPDTITSAQRDWQLICVKRHAFSNGINHIA